MSNKDLVPFGIIGGVLIVALLIAPAFSSTNNYFLDSNPPQLKKLCEVSATGNTTSISCSLTTSEQNLIIKVGVAYNTDATTVYRLRFNGDSGNNYALRSSTNGGADATTPNISGIIVLPASSTTGQFVYSEYRCYDHFTNQDKECYGERVTGANGAGNVASRVEQAGKWSNLLSHITTVEISRSAGTGTINTDSFLEVWGYS